MLRDDFREALGYDPGRFVDSRTARALAMAAFRHALKVRGDHPPESLFGIGATSKLATGDGERAGRTHEIHVALQTADSTQVRSIVLPLGGDRSWEERINSLLVFNAVALAKNVDPEVPLSHEGRAISTDWVREIASDWHDCRHSGLPRLSTDRQDWLAYDFLGDGRFLEADHGDALPRLILPGSFRPLHEGHLAMAEAATRLSGIPCGFELSLFHPEKPPLDYIEIRSRLKGFEGRSGRLYLTNAPTYVEKARLFPGCTFVVGHDTALRIVDPRFYGGPVGRDAALQELEQLGARFLVFGRVDASGAFRDFSSADFENPVAGFLERVATPIPGHVFRFDISSTEIRRRLGEE